MVSGIVWANRLPFDFLFPSTTTQGLLGTRFFKFHLFSCTIVPGTDYAGIVESVDPIINNFKISLPAWSSGEEAVPQECLVSSAVLPLLLCDSFRWSFDQLLQTKPAIDQGTTCCDWTDTQVVPDLPENFRKRINTSQNHFSSSVSMREGVYVFGSKSEKHKMTSAFTRRVASSSKTSQLSLSIHRCENEPQNPSNSKL
ncbi:hypothetical protein LXL04_021104 [Taraxacum kok-saghyz]